MGQPVGVLDEERPIEPLLLADLVDLGLGGILAGQRDGRVTGREMDEEEDAERRQQERRHQRDEATQHEAMHQPRLPVSSSSSA